MVSGRSDTTTCKSWQTSFSSRQADFHPLRENVFQLPPILPMHVTHWMEAGIGTLGLCRSSRLWCGTWFAPSLGVGRMSCPRPLSETGNGQNVTCHQSQHRAGHRVCAEESVGIFELSAVSATTLFHVCRVFCYGAVWLLTMRWLLDGAGCTTCGRLRYVCA